MAVKILGTGSYLPPKVVTNEDLAKELDTSDEWIFSHSGIHSRHIAGPGEGTASMAAEASKAALAAAGVAPSEFDMLVLTTCSSDYLLPVAVGIDALLGQLCKALDIAYADNERFDLIAGLIHVRQLDRCIIGDLLSLDKTCYLRTEIKIKLGIGNRRYCSGYGVSCI